MGFEGKSTLLHPRRVVGYIKITNLPSHRVHHQTILIIQWPGVPSSPPVEAQIEALGAKHSMCGFDGPWLLQASVKVGHLAPY